MANRIAPWLSTCSNVGSNTFKPSSLSRLRSHTASLAASAIAIYSASTVDEATVCCRLEHHTIGELLSLNIYPVVDLLVSWHPAQSASTQPSRSAGWCPPRDR